MDLLQHPDIPAPNYPPNARDWELRRPLITRLYRDDDKPLREVMDSMRRSGFRATPKMYKSRIQTWGLDKKLKEHEARAIVYMLARHRGKASYIRLRDRRVEIKAAESHLKRKGIAIDDVLNTDPPHVSSIVICETSDRSERVPRCLASPDAFKTTELLCVDVREYVLSSFGTGRWLTQSCDQHCINNELKTTMSSYDHFMVEVIALSRLKVLDQPGIATAVTPWASAKINDLIECQYPENFPMIIQVLATVLMILRRPLARMLIKRLCFMAATHDSGDSHVNMYPQRIFARIGQLGSSDELIGNLLAVTRSAMNSHEHILGQYHLQTIYHTVRLSQLMCVLYGREGLSEPLEALISKLESQQGPGTRQSRMLRDEMRRLRNWKPVIHDSRVRIIYSHFEAILLRKEG